MKCKHGIDLNEEWCQQCWNEKVALSCKRESTCSALTEMKLHEAEALAKSSGYAFLACEEDDPINWADAGQFFLEGYNYAKKLLAKQNAESEVSE